MSSRGATTGLLAIGSVGRHASGWWGMIMLILTEASLFAYLLFSYYYFAVQYGRSWLPLEPPSFALSLPNTVLLLLSSVVLIWGERAIRRGATRQLGAALAVAMLMGIIFMGVQSLEWINKPYRPWSNPYASLYFVVTGFHMAHVLAGVVILAVMLVWSLLGKFSAQRHAALSIGAIYWHFVDAVWLAVFFTFYITPYLG